MTNAIVPCQTIAPFFEGPETEHINNIITKDTDIYEFENYRAKLNIYKYKLITGNKHGIHVLIAAVIAENKMLINHIFKEGGIKLLSLGDKDGWTALHYAVKERSYEMVFLLIKLGSPINIT